MRKGLESFCTYFFLHVTLNCTVCLFFKTSTMHMVQLYGATVRPVRYLSCTPSTPTELNREGCMWLISFAHVSFFSPPKKISTLERRDMHFGFRLPIRLKLVLKCNFGEDIQQIITFIFSLLWIVDGYHIVVT